MANSRAYLPFNLEDFMVTVKFMKKSILVVIAIGTMILCVIYYGWSFHRDVASSVTDIIAEESDANNSLREKVQQISTVSNEKIEISSSNIKSPEDDIRITTTSIYGDDKEMNEAKKWLSIRSSPWGDAKENEAVYKNYETSVLEQLSDSGDIVAMHVLADRYLNEFIARGDGQHGIELQRQTFSRAATYGSTWALNQIALSLSTEAALVNSPEQRRNMILDSLAYLDVAERRGDRLPKITSRKLTLEEYGFSPSKEELEHIKNRANAIYDDMAEKRQELGLPEFDNNVPESVSRFFSRMEGK